MPRPETYISDDDWYDMRKRRAGGQTIEQIAEEKTVSVRQVRKATVGIEPGREYAEEKLKERVKESEAETEREEEEEQHETEEGPEMETPSVTRPPRTSARDRVLVRDYEELLKAAEVKPNILLTLLSEAYRAGYSSLGEWLEGEVLPWMRLATWVQAKFANAARPGEPISPEEFRSVFTRYVVENRDLKLKYDGLRKKVNGLRGTIEKRSRSRRKEDGD